MARAAVLALLLVLALPMGVAAVPSDASGPAATDIAILTLDGPARGSFATSSLDVATTLAIQHDEADARLDRYTLDERMRRTASTEARQALLFEAVTSVRTRIAALREDDRELRAAYTAGEVDTETYVRRLAILDQRAAVLRAALDRIQAHAADIPQFSLRGRVRLLDAALFGFQGPVRGQAVTALRGQDSPVRLFVAASADGVVVSTIEDGRYVREAYRASNRDVENVSGMTLNEAAARTSELYPTAYNSSKSIRTGINGLSGGLYRIDIEFREGSLTAYLDGATRNVFFEIQERRLDLLGTRPSAVASANGTRIAVNRSYPGGPLRVQVTDNETGTPFSTTVVVAGERFQTGDDGRLWTLAPASVTFEVTAIGPTGNVTVSVRPLAPTPVTGEG